jgi:hypothetical protein
LGMIFSEDRFALFRIMPQSAKGIAKGTPEIFQRKT